MGAKEDLLADLVHHDASGCVEVIHEKLIACGLKWKGSKNSATLLYFFRHQGKEVGVAAMRRGTFSFPKRFWSVRALALPNALARVASHQQIPTQPAISSSQESAGQIQIGKATVEPIKDIIDSIIIPEARHAGAALP